MIKQRFGGSSPYSVGIEEEVMILDADTHAPVAGSPALVEAGAELRLPGQLKTELHASVVELTTDVCADVDEAVEALAHLRDAAARLARARGWVIAAAGMHPTASAHSLPIVQEERYLRMVDQLGLTARMQGVSGLHVHIGLESPDACHAALEAVLPWLPVVLALSANSPFLEGEANGMWSNRAPVLASLPRAGAPPVFGSYGAWEAWVERLVRLGVLEDYTRVWWDARPHPLLGTLEVRIADQPTALERTAMLARLVRDLVERAPRREADPAARGDYAQNRWAAAHHGLEAELLHPGSDRLTTARELAAELLDALPPEPEAAAQLAAGAAGAAADIAARTLD